MSKLINPVPDTDRLAPMPVAQALNLAFAPKLRPLAPAAPAQRTKTLVKQEVLAEHAHLYVRLAYQFPMHRVVHLETGRVLSQYSHVVGTEATRRASRDGFRFLA